MHDKLIISAYGSHNACISMHYKGVWKNIELERWLNSKNIGLTNYLPCKYPQVVFDEITDYLLSTVDKKEVDVYLTDYVKDIVPKFKYKEHKHFDHHTAHAATAFYQSPYQEALIFSWDGGGDGGFFNVYLANRKDGIKLLEKFGQDLGFAYMIFGDYLADIKKDPLNIGNLVWSGKLMGITSYGVCNDQWLPHFEKFYEKFNYTGRSYLGGAEVKNEALIQLFNNIGIKNFDVTSTRFEGQVAWDIAATSQRAFERQFFKYAQSYLNKYPQMPVALTGGCALNVLLNAKLLKMRDNKVFVPPNVNDCGIAVGGILWYMNPQTQIDLTYSGTPLLDENQMGTLLQEHHLVMHENVTPFEIAELVAAGKIIGIIQGDSEHGSRALGNRSIICDPVGDMKNILNKKVKHREWYRPFAPIVRLEDCPKYFKFDKDVESRHMVFVAEVREEWRKVLPAITHEDNTARLQTVTESQNKFIYDLLGEVDKLTGHGVILNTSFNVDGKPILTRLSDAFKILNQTELDALYVNGKLILKHYDDSFRKKVITYKKSEPSQYSLNIMMFNDADNIDADVKSIKKLMSVHKNILLIIPQYNYQKYKTMLPESESLQYFRVKPHQHYYDSRLRESHNMGLETTNDYAKYVKLLWMKEIVNNNIYDTKYHLFVDFNTIPIKNIMDILSQTKNKLTDDTICISTDSSNRLISSYFAGNTENMEWMSNHYEAMMLSHLTSEEAKTESDYLELSRLDTPYKYSYWTT